MKKQLVNKFTRKLNAFLKDNHGFTLIEIIFTIMFASIALFATMTMMSTSMLGSMNVEFMNTSANLANVKMEELFSDKKTRGYGYIQEINYPYETDVDGFPGFNRYVEITTQATDKKVTVRVTHPDIGDIVMVAFMTNY